MLPVIVALLAFSLGSIPTGFLLARRRGIDVRASGSGNIGATNVTRTAGRSLGLWTLTGDALKGFLPVALVEVATGLPGLAAVAAVAAVAGHCFSLFLRFRGGKGVATALGALLALAPLVVSFGALAFAAALLATRTVSVGSIVAAFACVAAAGIFHYPAAVFAAVGTIAALVLWRHRENFARLAAGTEPQI